MDIKKLFIPINDNIPTLSLEDAKNIKNPTRGLRLEFSYTFNSDTINPNSEILALEYLKDTMALPENKNATVALVKVYLSDYTNSPIDGNCFLDLTDFIFNLRKYDLDVILRFAYNNSKNITVENKIIIAHIEQIEEWYIAYKKVLKSIIKAIQFGFYDKDGECINLDKKLDTSYIWRFLFKAFQNEYPIQISNFQLWNDAPANEKSLIAFNNDYITDKNSDFNLTHNNIVDLEKYLDLYNSKFNDYTLSNNISNILNTLTWLKDIKPSTLSLSKCTEEIKNILLSKTDLIKYNLPYNPFIIDGEITLANYLALHIGYHLTVSNIEISKNKFSAVISNFGFNIPYGFNNLYILAVDNVSSKEIKIKNFEARLLGSNGQFKIELELENIHNSFIGIKLENDFSQPIRFINDLKFEFGVNFIN